MRFNKTTSTCPPVVDGVASYLGMNIPLPTFRVLALRVRLSVEAFVVCHITLFTRDEPEPAHDGRCRAHPFHAEGRA